MKCPPNFGGHFIKHYLSAHSYTPLSPSQSMLRVRARCFHSTALRHELRVQSVLHSLPDQMGTNRGKVLEHDARPRDKHQPCDREQLDQLMGQPCLEYAKTFLI